MSAFAGMLRKCPDQTGESACHPLPAKFMACARKDWGGFQVTQVMTLETFSMPIYSSYPPAAGAPQARLNAIENDGMNFIVPVDLTGRGLSDLMIGRKGWGGWRVYSNGQAMSKPFDGFLEGLYGKGEETLKTQILPMDLSDLEVDNNLLATVGDFLGNGTEQLAYCRPGWNAIQVVGAHGKVAFEADLRGIPTDVKGERLHFLFAFKGDKPGERTKIAYHRKGCGKLMVFTSDGSRFTRSEADTMSHWNMLNQCQPHPM